MFLARTVSATLAASSVIFLTGPRFSLHNRDRSPRSSACAWLRQPPRQRSDTDADLVVGERLIIARVEREVAQVRVGVQASEVGGQHAHQELAGAEHVAAGATLACLDDRIGVERVRVGLSVTGHPTRHQLSQLALGCTRVRRPELRALQLQPVPGQGERLEELLSRVGTRRDARVVFSKRVHASP